MIIIAIIIAIILVFIWFELYLLNKNFVETINKVIIPFLKKQKED